MNATGLIQERAGRLNTQYQKSLRADGGYTARGYFPGGGLSEDTVAEIRNNVLTNVCKQAFSTNADIRNAYLNCCAAVNVLCVGDKAAYFPAFINILEVTRIIDAHDLSLLKSATLGLSNNGYLVAFKALKDDAKSKVMSHLKDIRQGTAANQIKRFIEGERELQNRAFDAESYFIVRLAQAGCSKPTQEACFQLFNDVAATAAKCSSEAGLQDILRSLTTATAAKVVKLGQAQSINHLKISAGTSAQAASIVGAQLLALGINPVENTVLQDYIECVALGLITESEIKQDLKTVLAAYPAGYQGDRAGQLAAHVSNTDELFHITTAHLHELKTSRGSKVHVINSLLVHLSPFLKNGSPFAAFMTTLLKLRLLYIEKERFNNPSLKMSRQEKQRFENYNAQMTEIKEYIKTKLETAGVTEGAPAAALSQAMAASFATQQASKVYKTEGAMLDFKTEVPARNLMNAPFTSQRDAVQDFGARSEAREFAYPLGRKSAKGARAQAQPQPQRPQQFERPQYLRPNEEEGFVDQSQVPPQPQQQAQQSKRWFGL